MADVKMPGLTAREATIVDGMLTAIAELLRQVNGRLDALERDVNEVRAFRYCGVWSEHQQYNANDFATHNGSVWHCRESTRQRPGDGNVWSLAVKRGKDGRDAR